MSLPEELTAMEREEEIDFFHKEYPDLERWEIAEILDIMDMDGVMDKFWRENPTLPIETVDSLAEINREASAHYYLYKKNNNEAS